MRNTIEDIDRREEIKRRNKERRTKLAATMRTALQDSISSPNYASMATLPANLTVTDARDLSTMGAKLPPLARLSVPQFAETTRAKDRAAIQMKMKSTLTPAEIRAKGKKELAGKQSPHHGKPLKKKGQLKPLRSQKNNINASSHTELIRSMEEGKGEESRQYYYCLRGRQFYEFFACSFNDIPKDGDYITISSRVRDSAHYFIYRE